MTKRYLQYEFDSTKYEYNVHLFFDVRITQHDNRQIERQINTRIFLKAKYYLPTNNNNEFKFKNIEIQKK